MKITFKILLLVAVIALGYLCVKSILDPIAFTEEKARREKLVINRLIEIRNAQVEFKNQHTRYTTSFDTLVDFVKNGKVAQIMKEGVLTDEQLQQGLTEVEAVKKGIIKRDTVYVPAKEFLFGASFNADSLAFIPETSTKFEMSASEIQTASGIVVKVFEAKTPFEVYLQGLDRQEVINLKDYAKKLDRFPGLQVGSVKEVNNNAGNWE